MNTPAAVPALISVCIPTKNKAIWLKYLLAYLLPQAQPLNGRVEIVVSDNLSSDETPELLVQFKSEFPDIFHYTKQPTAVGMFDNFQKVLELAKGEYLWLIGNDDYPKIGIFDKIISILSQHPNVDFIHLGHSLYTPGTTPEQTPGLSQAIHKPIFKTYEQYLKSVSQVVTFDPSCFTAIYCCIVRHKFWAHCCTQAAGLTPFDSTLAVVPHTIYIINHLLDNPAYYIADTCLMASRDVTWPEHMQIYLFEYLPDIFMRLEAKGISRKILDKHRQQLFTHNYVNLAQLLMSQDKRFCLIKFLQDNKHLRAFWVMFFKAFLWIIIIKLRTHLWLTPLLRVCIPIKFYKKLKKLGT